MSFQSPEVRRALWGIHPRLLAEAKAVRPDPLEAYHLVHAAMLSAVAEAPSVLGDPEAVRKLIRNAAQAHPA
ncbi:MAG: hypothetical protein LPJ86_05650 [Caulobacteraceae bacterium]|nr:hypothetical protein [Caulobacteraceae bacterium]